MDCVHHPGEHAPYQCYRCREFICPDCESKLEGRSYCRSCMANIHQRVVDQYAAETRNISYPTAFLSGLVAAIIVASIWSQVAVWLSFRLPIWPALVGGAVGWAILAGSGKRSENLQKMAAVITLAGIFAGLFLAAFRSGSYAELLQGQGLRPRWLYPPQRHPQHLSGLLAECRALPVGFSGRRDRLGMVYTSCAQRAGVTRGNV